MGSAVSTPPIRHKMRSVLLVLGLLLGSLSVWGEEIYKNEGAVGESGGVTASGNINSTASNGNPAPAFGNTSAGNKTFIFSGFDVSDYTDLSLSIDAAFKNFPSTTNTWPYATITFYKNDVAVKVDNTTIKWSSKVNTYSTYVIDDNIPDFDKIVIEGSPAVGKSGSGKDATNYGMYLDNIILSGTLISGGTPDPVLESITIDGDLFTKEYEEGKDIDFTGLTATGHYDNSSTADLTSSVDWSFSPALTVGLTSVTVTATKDAISGNKVINGLTVDAHVVTAGTYDITFNNAFFGTTGLTGSLSGTNLKDYSGSKDDITVEYKKGTGSNMYLKDSEIRLYSGNTLVITAPSGYNITSVTGLKSTMMANEGTITDTEWSGESNSVTFSHANSTGNSALTTISVTYEAYVAPTVAVPTFSVAEGTYLGTQSVEINCATVGADIYYTLDGTDPSSASTPYSSAISITETKTLRAIATKGSAESAIASATYTIVTTEHAGTEVDPYSVADALAVISTLADNASTAEEVYVSGIISQVDSYNNSYNSITYWISADGATTNQLEVYGGLAGVALGGAAFSSKEDLQTGDEVVVHGTLKKYKSGTTVTPEFNLNSTITSFNRPVVAVTSVALTESTASVEAGETVTLHASVVPDNATNKTIVWSVQSGNTYASVDANGVVTGIAAGEAVIRAASEEDASIYKECTVTVTAADPTKHVVTFDATVDKGESPLNKSNITLSCSNGALNNGTEYRLYKNSTTTIACSAGNITKIEFTGVSGNPVSGFGAPEVGTLVTDGDDGVWTGNAASITFTASGAQVRATEIKVTYKEDNRAEAGLAYETTDIVKHVGDETFVNVLTNPNNLTVAYESSNTEVAEVAANGTVTIKGEGATTITASFDGDANYKPATVSCNITVTAAPVVLTDYYEKVTNTAGIVEGTYLIVYEEGSVAFDGSLTTLDAESNTIDVAITTDNKIGVTSATEASTFYIDPAAGTVKSASDNFIGVGSWTNGLKQDKEYAHNVLEIDGDGNAQIGIYNADWNTTGGTMRLQYNKSAGQTRFRYYKNGGQQAIALYKLANEVIKPEAGLAWNPADDIELTVGETFTAPALQNPNSIDAAEITIESSNTSLATVTAGGVVELVADATGTATITATFAGNASYKSATVSYKIKVNPASSIYVAPSLNVNFGSVEKDATAPADQTITVTLNNVAAATATLGGANPEAFSITPASPAALISSGDITISVVSTATVGEFKATLTISDDASAAASKEVKLSFTVTDPASEETAISTSTEWVAATEITDGMQVLITGVKNEVTYAMGAQRNNNRGAVAGTLDGEGVFTPGENTMSFTLEATGATDTYYIKSSNGKYLYNASTSGNSYLRLKDAQDDASWTITLSGNEAIITSVENTNRTIMRFNKNGNNDPLFCCYASGQEAIALYVPKPVTPPTPVYEEVRPGLTAGNYYTICYNKKMTAIQGATLWSFIGRDANFAYLVQEDAPFAAGKPYIMYAESDKLEAVLEGDAVEASAIVANGAIHGTFTNMDQAALSGAGDNIYLVIGNQLRRVDGRTGNSLPAYRAYVDLDEITGGAPSSMPGRKVRSMPMQGQTATGMDELNASETPVKMLIDGQLFILRGEKMYNANGQLVK